MAGDTPFRVAIVGSGPAGFYAAGQLLASQDQCFAVDLFDRLPTPFGLVRAGVAPDHPKIKTVTRAFAKTAEHERFRFFGHVELGTDISRAELLARYHAIIYAVGTPTDRRLGIDGEQLAGSHSATEFVAWYNGHPDHNGLEIDLQARQVVVIGAGNVAIDVARMLALTPEELAPTDAADHAIEVMARSGVEEITILARRGPLQAAFTNPELLELGELERADLDIVGGGALDAFSEQALLTADKTRRRNVEILREYAKRGRSGKPVTLRLRFLVSPVALLDDGHGHVRAVAVETNQIAERNGRSIAAGTGTFEEIPAQLVFRSIGYTGVPVADVPFDAARGLIRNDGGRVLNDGGEVCRGEYVSGWIKRGPSGVIGTNKKDSQDTVAKVIEDAVTGRLSAPVNDDIRTLLDERAAHYVEWDGWQAIDLAETSAGECSRPGRPRVKLTDWERLGAAGSSVRAAR